jgi:hypothetical protein
MDFFKSLNDQLDDLLHRICGKLQITKTQYAEAETHYTAVTEWLAEDEDLFYGADIQIYPQGSLRLGTTVKPLSDQEFDLDLVCEVHQPWHPHMNPIETLNSIERRLRDHKTYAPMVQRMNRCIRLNYADEFHMDILPAYPAIAREDGALKVPDRELKGWKDSNPKGFADWFENECAQVTIVFDKAAEVEPLPIPEAAEQKPPLKRAVQLMKRYRDVYFADNPKLAPISIVLSTLAARNYGGQASVTSAISYITEGILKEIESSKDSRVYVYNPSNPREDLSERWGAHPERYQAFVQFIGDFRDHWVSVVQTRGLPNLSAELNSMFGEEVTSEAVKNQVAFVEKVRRYGRLGVLNETGRLSFSVGAAATTTVKPNTFYGEE